MLLMCIEDIFIDNKKTKIFSAGKAYRGIYDSYFSSLNDKEKEAFKTLSDTQRHIEDMSKWGIIRAKNNFGNLWTIEIIENPEFYNPSSPFKNNSFIQISTFSGGIYK